MLPLSAHSALIAKKVAQSGVFSLFVNRPGCKRVSALQKAASRVVNKMPTLADISYKTEGAASAVDPVILALNLLLVVVVLLISPLRGAAQEPAR